MQIILTTLLGLSLSLAAQSSYAELSETEFMNVFQQSISNKDPDALEKLVRDNPEQSKNVNKKLRNIPSNTPHAAKLQQLGQMLWEVSASILAEKAKKNGTLPTPAELQDAIKMQKGK